MKHKFWIAVLSILTALCLCIGITACGGNSGDNQGSNPPVGDNSGDEQGGGTPTDHEHTYGVDNKCSECNDVWAFTEGLQYTSIDNGAHYAVSGIGSASGDIVIAYGYNGKAVTEIAANAFSHTNITSVTVPDSVTAIGEFAFAYTESCTSITLGDNVTTIGNTAFFRCRITSITLPDSVTSFAGAFSNCTSLTEITIPDKVTSIGYKAFADCTGLRSITIGNGVTSIGECAFSGCTSLTDVTLGDSVTSIDTLAFQRCTSLESITIPASVTSIVGGAFSQCSKLTSVTFETTSGWKVIPDTGSGTQSVPSSSLEDPSTAAQYLANSNRYCWYDWTRSE